MPSTNKYAFFQGTKTSYYMKASDYQKIISHYAAKGIVILINGQTNLIPNEQAKIRLQTSINLLENDKTKYAEYIRLSWPNLYPLVKDELKALISPFLTTEHILKQETTLADLIEATKNLNSFCKKELDEDINGLIETLKKQVASGDFCIEKADIVEEIKYIQQNLRPNDVVGYIFTNGRLLTEDHFEVLIITPNEIIKPIKWGNINHKKEIRPTDIPSMYFTPVFKPIVSMSYAYFSYPQAQSQAIECGTLGLMYLKEMLKDAAMQLKEFTLRFPFYNELNKQWENFFFPSPQVLRYSQSEFYNELILRLLDDCDEEKYFESGRRSYSYKPLKLILQNSLKKLKEENEPNLQIELVRSLLDNLPDFRKKWIGEYKRMEQKRNEMTKEGVNYYLAYSSQRMGAIASSMLA